jgi:hypothetical protein
MLKVACTGPASIIPEGTAELLAGETDPQLIDARSVQIYYTGRVAASARIALKLEKHDETVTIAGMPAAPV